MESQGIENKCELFADALARHAKRKEELYDGRNASMSTEFWIIALQEEIGEIASAYIRQRNANIVSECIDVAHTAMLLALSIQSSAVILEQYKNGE